MMRSALPALGIWLIACVGGTALSADLPPDTMRQLRSPVSGYRGEVADVQILPDGDPSLPAGPDLPEMARRALSYLGNNPVPENKYQCRFWNMLLLCPPAPLPDPRKERIVLTAKADGDYLVRPPGWAPRSAVHARRGGKPVEVYWGGTVERAYTYSWTGSTVTSVDPQGEWLPLYGQGVGK